MITKSDIRFFQCWDLLPFFKETEWYSIKWSKIKGMWTFCPMEHSFIVMKSINCPLKAVCLAHRPHWPLDGNFMAFSSDWQYGLVCSDWVQCGRINVTCHFGPHHWNSSVTQQVLFGLRVPLHTDSPELIRSWYNAISFLFCANVRSMTFLCWPVTILPYSHVQRKWIMTNILT